MKKTILSLILCSLLCGTTNQSQAEISPQEHAIGCALITIATGLGTWYCHHRTDACEKILRHIQIIEKYELPQALEEFTMSDNYKKFKKRITRNRKLFHTLTWALGPLAIASFASTGWGAYRCNENQLYKDKTERNTTKKTNRKLYIDKPYNQNPIYEPPKPQKTQASASTKKPLKDSFISSETQTILSLLAAFGTGTGTGYCLYKANKYKKLLNTIQTQEKYDLPNLEQETISKEKIAAI